MLAARDYRAAAAFLRRLYGHRELASFPHFLVRELHALAGAEQVSWNNLALSVPWAEIVAYPAYDNPEQVADAFTRHMHEHPGIREWLSLGITGTRAISDFLSRHDYHRTGIYQNLYRGLGFEDQLCPALTPPHGQAIALAFGLGRRGVTDHDRELVDFVAPHVLQAYRNLQALARTERALAGYREVAAALGQCAIELDPEGRPLDFPARAQRWLREYFPDAPLRGAAGLPVSVAAWVRQRARYNGAGEGAAQPPLVRRRGARRLVLRLVSCDDGGAILLLAERTTVDDTEHLRRAGLTRREIDVLIEIEAGKTNAETAADLCLSPATVKKHLENIYAKLNVSNRTAAVACLRRKRT